MKIEILSQNNFDKYCSENNLTDENVETLASDTAFISIVGLKDTLQVLDIEQTGHWFKENHSNVLNLDFDDTPYDLNYKGVRVKTMTDEQTKTVIDFIESNLGKNFKIHCLAGISRSGAIGTFISENYEEYKNSIVDVGYIRPNIGILSKLNREIRLRSEFYK